MRRILVVGTTLAGLLGVGVVTAGPASADLACNGTIFEQTVPDSIVVPSGATCIIAASTILGSVTVQPNAKLFTGQVGDREAQIEGALFADRAHVELLPGSRVGGSADIARPKALDEEVTGAVCSSRIGGELFVHNAPDDLNDGHRFFIGGNNCGGNRIGASLRVIANKVTVQIGGNIIGANLECRRNDPPPVADGANSTTGVKSGQCRAANGF